MTILVENKIFLIWQPSEHKKRYIVGELIQIDGKNYIFRYIKGDDLDEAIKKGFSGYPAFSDLDREYQENVLQTFSMRFPSRQSENFKKLLRYWQIYDQNINDFDLLSITGGQLATDTFEFIDPHSNKRPNAFLTEVAGFVFYADEKQLRTFNEGTKLDLKREPENNYDPFAVEVLYQGEKIGYIKRVHAETISKLLEQGINVEAELVNINANGIINSVLLKIYIK